MKKSISKRIFGFGFDRASHSTGNGLLMDTSNDSDNFSITTTQRYRHDIRDAVREIYFQETN